MTTAAPAVHIEVEGFQAFTEFPKEFDPSYPKITDACGPCASITCLNAVMRWGHPVDVLVAEMVHRRTQDIENGMFTAGSGQNLDNLEASVHLWNPTVVTHKTPMGSDPQTLRANLKAAMLRGNPCVVQVLAAGGKNAQGTTNIPFNEPGVEHHFFAAGGIDTALGYKIANGDRYPFAALVEAYWVKIQSFLDAQFYGLLEFEMMPATVPPPVVTPTPDITTALADLAAAETLLTKIKAELQ